MPPATPHNGSPDPEPPSVDGRPAARPGLVQVSIDPRAWSTWSRRAWALLGLCLLVWLAYLVREIWLPLAIAFLIAMVLDPVVDRMERRGWKRVWATLFIFIGFFATLAGLLYFAVPAVVSQASQISAQVGEYIPAPGNQARAQRSITRTLDRANAPGYVRAAVERGVIQLNQTLTRSTAWLGEHAMDVLSNAVWLVIIPIVTFYALKDFHLLFAKSLLIVPRERRDFVQTMVSEVTTIFAKFLRGLVLVSFLNGLATWVLLAALRTPNAFTLGAIAGLLYSIPYLGAILTIVLTAGVAFLHGGLHYMLLVVACSVLLHQLLFDQIVTPRVLGGHVGIHPILSIVALLAGNVLLGILGMLLAVPVAASIQMVVVTLVPKLREEISLHPNLHDPRESVGGLSELTKEEHVRRDATEELHESVTQAVDAIEARVEEAA